MNNDDHVWMKLALEQAEKAAEIDEVPVGACIIDAEGHLLAAASNRTITDNDPTAHAEILAIRLAARNIGNYRLTGTMLYTTIEPCAMCAGAIVNARIARLVFGAHDERYGAVESVFRLCDSEVLNHRLDITSGILAVESGDLMRAFFREKRAST